MAAGARSGNAALWFVLGVVAGVLLCVAALVGYTLWQTPERVASRPTPVPTAVATPTPSVAPPAAATPPEEGPSPEARPVPAPTRRPAAPPGAPLPGPATPAPDLPRHLAEGDSALVQGRWQAAQAAYEQALRLEPGNARAQAGRTQAAAGLARLRRGFVPELAVGEGGPATGPAGFETGGVVVRKAPQVPARVNFAVTPAHVEPGAPYSITVALVNFGKKGVKLRTLRLIETVNGRRTLSEPAPQVGEVRKGQRSALAVLSGAWPAATQEWSLEVQVVTTQGDIYAGKLAWR